MQTGDGGVIIVSVLSPVVSISTRSTDVCHGGKGCSILCMAVGEEYHHAVKVVCFRVVVHELDGF